MDPFYSYASRFVTWDDENDDHNRKGPEDPRLRAIVVEEPGSERHIEFNVRVDAICAVSPYIKTMFDIYPTKRRLGIESATADHMQILLKYMNTHIYDPTDISYRHLNKHDIVFRHIDFYLFCQKLGYKSLSDVVRAGIQASLDLMTWSPAPVAGDTVLLHPRVGSSSKERSNEKPSDSPLLESLLSTCEWYYPKIKRYDPIKKSLLAYGYHLWTQGDPIRRRVLIYSHYLWPNFRTYLSNQLLDEQILTKPSPELWIAMKEYNSTRPFDIYKIEAPKYSNRFNSVFWSVGVGVIFVGTLTLVCTAFIPHQK